MKHYFTADLHLGHQMMARMRGFESVEEMNKTLIDGINLVATFNDQLWILGDFSYRINKDEAQALLKQICCRHVHLINGNHDKVWTTDDGFETVEDYHELKMDGRKIVLCHYPLMSWNGMRQPHQFMSWNKGDRGSYHFYGHVHGKEIDNQINARTERLCYDVGVDANPYTPYRPESLDEIIGRMDAWANEKQDTTYSIRAAWSDDDYCYLAAVPEIPGCIADGSTPEEAVNHLREIINIQLEGCIEDDRPVPEPRHYDLGEEMNRGYWHINEQ